ncbi:ABC transporter permease [Luteimicrobium xylanilyticum]|uniref:Aliphatic sulfonates transport permease protein SsuC n=1 Tax=Luteimicrobium xylanilyticum TaxID=1133546 RepID=A0A5P9QG34_9MICO|nr:ABC transporter permease [Luteimicrobium xylanilyticum]QFU99990.1 Putative aliphatic sulfonates transport permease protein SsuC [Luteimicrobium xylanilyticum]
MTVTARHPAPASAPVPAAATAVGAAATAEARGLVVEQLSGSTDRRRRIRVPRSVARLSGVVVVLAVWQLAAVTGRLPRTFLGSPVDVARAAGHLIADGELPAAIGASLQRVGVGLVLGLAAGIVLALVSGLSRIGEDLVDAPVQMLRTVPFAGLVPLLIIWLGVGETPKIVLIALGVTFPVYINLSAGIRQVDPGLVEAGRTLGLSRLGLVRHVVAGAALPQLLVGVRIALGVSWLALVFAEQISATSGIGYLMTSAQELLQTDTIVVCLVVYALLGLLADLVVRVLERVLLPWRRSFTPDDVQGGTR